MGFCMATSGMTQGDQEEPPCDLEMEGGTLEDVELKDKSESMDDDQDHEVLQCFYFQLHDCFC